MGLYLIYTIATKLRALKLAVFSTRINEEEKLADKLDQMEQRTVLYSTNTEVTKDLLKSLPNGNHITLLDAMFILLQKFKKLLSVELWDYISSIFPYFEDLCDPREGNIEIHKLSEQNQEIFLISKQHLPACPGVFTIALNPRKRLRRRHSFSELRGPHGNDVTKILFSHDRDIVRWLKSEDTELKLPMKKKHLRPSLSSYTSGFTENLFLKRKRKSKGKDPTNNLPQKLYLEQDQGESSKSHSGSISDDSSDVEMISEVKKPKASNACVLVVEVDDEAQRLPQRSSTDDCKMSEKNCKNSKSNDQGMHSKCEMREVLKKKSVCDSKSSFIDELKFTYNDLGPSMDPTYRKKEVVLLEESAWSADSKMLSFREQKAESIRSIFEKYSEQHSWLKLSDLNNLIVCSSCRYIEDNYGIRGLSLQIPVDDLFKSHISRTMHHHAEQKFHKASHIIAQKNIITSLRLLILNHFNAFDHYAALLEALQNLLPNEHITLEDLQVYVSLLGKYLEFQILEAAKQAKTASIIADPCRGYLIIRFIKNFVPVEHILSSYMNCTDKSPIEYVANLLPGMKIPFYVCNSGCNLCSRCQISKEKRSPAIPVAFPKIEVYLMFLWRSKPLLEYFKFASSLLEVFQSLNNPELNAKIDLNRLIKFPIIPSELLRLSSLKETIKNALRMADSLEARTKLKFIDSFEWKRIENYRDIFLQLENINTCILQVSQCMSAIDDLYVHFDHLRVAVSGKTHNSSDAKNWEEVTSLVSLTIRELQCNIYHRGRYLSSSYKIATTYDNLCKIEGRKMSLHSLSKLSEILTLNEIHDSKSLISCMRKFLESHRFLERESPCSVLHQFSEDTSKARKYPHSFQFYSTLSLIAFHPCLSPKSLQEIQIFEHQFHRSAWSGIGGHAKSYLLTALSELTAGIQVNEQQMVKFFFCIT